MTRFINEQDEFLLSRLLDGDLPAEQDEALRRRMERDPELRRVYAQLAGVDKLLAGRRTDRPEVQWGAFRREIMDRVRRQDTRGRVIRLASWLRVGVPLAAAASIALAVFVYQYRSAREQPVGDRPVTVVVHDPVRDQAPSTATEEEPVVIFHRPAALAATARLTAHTETGARTSPADEIEVIFEKSPELTEQYRQRDQMLRGSPSMQYHVGSPPVIPPDVDELFDTLEPVG